MTSTKNSALAVLVLGLSLAGSLVLVRSESAVAVPADRAKAAPVREKTETKAAVVFDGKQLFYVQKRVLSFSPEDRARIISERIRKLAMDPLVDPGVVSVLDAESSSDIVAGDLVLMTIGEADAKAEGRPRHEVAVADAEQIQKAIESYRKSYSLKAILLGALFTTIVTAILVLILVMFNRGFPRIYARLNDWRGTYIRSVRIQRLELIPATRITDFVISLVKAARVIAVILLFYLYFPLVFSFFPWTRGFSPTLLNYILSPLYAVVGGFLSFLPNIFFIAVIVLVARYFIKFIGWIFRQIERGTITFPGFYRDWADTTFKIVRFLIIAFTVVVIFPYLPGSESPAFHGISIFLGVLFSLGSTSAVANVVAGVIVTYMRGFTIGDRVKIADTVGDVIEKTVLITRIRTIKNVDVTIPNAAVLGSHIINYSSSAKRAGLILHTTVSIGYNAPWKKVHELLAAAARSTEHVLSEPAPFVLQTSLNDFYVSYELNAYTDQPRRMANIYSDLHQNIQDKFNEAGIEIMSPHYSALRDGNSTAIPEDYLPKNYEPPGFRIDRAGDPG